MRPGGFLYVAQNRDPSDIVEFGQSRFENATPLNKKNFS
jgi:hypothetical protein